MEGRQADIQANSADPFKEDSMKRLSKRLAYLLRYGAVKEGLDVDGNGYVELDELCSVNLLQRHSKAEVLEAIKSSISYRQTNRYDCRERNGLTYVRAAYLRNFEKNPFHGKTNVKTLFETAMSYICNNLDEYDLEDFPDENILRSMIRRMKREKRLSNRALGVLLAPTITRLDLEGVYLTRNTLRMVWTQCPNLQAVSLRDCGYIMTDTVLAQFTKNLPCLERLNLCMCPHFTDRCLKTLTKNLPRLNTLHMAQVPCLTATAVLQFIRSAKSLKFLDVYSLRVSESEYTALKEAAEAQGLTLILRGPRQRKGQELGDENVQEEADDDIDYLSDGVVDVDDDDDDDDDDDGDEDDDDDNNSDSCEDGEEDDAAAGDEVVDLFQNGAGSMNDEWSEEAAIAASLFGWEES